MDSVENARAAKAAKANARYYVYNEVEEPGSLDSVEELVKFFALHGIPLDAKLSFSGHPGPITRVDRVEKLFNSVYVTLGTDE
jgi:hypothetical protein